MKKTVFNNQNFYILLLVAITLLLFWNLYIFLTFQNIFALIPAIIQVAVLILILTKNEHAKLGIKIWSVLLIAGPALSIIGKSIKIFLGDDIMSKVSPLAVQFVILICGLTIHHYNKTTVEVKEIIKEELNK